ARPARCVHPTMDRVLLIAGPVASTSRSIADQHRLGEHTLAHELLLVVEQPVDALKPQVAHADRVRVRIAQGNRHAAAPILADSALLARQALALNLDVLCANAPHLPTAESTPWLPLPLGRGFTKGGGYRRRPRRNGGMSRSSSELNTGSGSVPIEPTRIGPCSRSGGRSRSRS